MKKNIFILLAVLFFSFVAFNSSFAQLKRDVQYVRGKVVSMDNVKKTLVIRVNDKDAKTFDIAQARITGQLALGQDVFVIAPINSNHAKSVRVVQKK